METWCKFSNQHRLFLVDKKAFDENIDVNENVYDVFECELVSEILKRVVDDGMLF